MDFLHQIQDFYQTYVTLENIEGFLQGYIGYGPLIGILLPMLEAFFPILPLFVFVLANAAAYGIFLGFLLSWVGTCAGSFIVFLFFRKVARKPFKRLVSKSKKISSMLIWVEKRGFGSLFILFCFPFTPSSLINVVSGLSDMNAKVFYLAVLLGKMVMIGTVTVIGNDWQSLIKQPIRLIVVVFVFVVLWVVGNVIEKRFKITQSEGDKASNR